MPRGRRKVTLRQQRVMRGARRAVASKYGLTDRGRNFGRGMRKAYRQRGYGRTARAYTRTAVGAIRSSGVTRKEVRGARRVLTRAARRR
jgi:hypothetical protein